MTQDNDKFIQEHFGGLYHQVFMRPPSPPSDTIRVATLYSGGRVSAVIEALDLDVVWKHKATDPVLPDFDEIPYIDFLVANILDPQDKAIEYVMRYLRVRRPWVFLLVRGDVDAEFLLNVQDKTKRLGYVVNRTVRNRTSFLVGTLGQDLPNQDGDGESLVGRIIRMCGEEG